MSTRRANGEGSVYRRADGSYEAKITVTDPVTGARNRVSLYAPTAKAVRAKMKAANTRADSGAPITDAKSSVGAWLSRWRATTLAASDRKPATKSLYAALSKKHLEPAPFGATSLDRLKPTDVEGLILALKDKQLPESTVRQVFIVLRMALDGAVRDQLIAVNPATRVARPTVTKREAVHLSPADVSALLAACASSRYHGALVVMAATGLRRGEVLALPWSAVDLDGGVLRVSATVGRIDGALVVSCTQDSHQSPHGAAGPRRGGSAEAAQHGADGGAVGGAHLDRYRAGVHR
jgi:hypothetical protein